MVALCCGEGGLCDVSSSCESVFDVADVLKLVELGYLVEQLSLNDGNLLFKCSGVLLCLSEAADVKCESA